MIDKETYDIVKNLTISFFTKANIAISNQEKKEIEIADFGLNDIWNTGLQLITYINTERVCSKEMVLFPNQTCPEHKHPTINQQPGKEETFRCRYGTVYLYVEGKKNTKNDIEHPTGTFTVFHEIVLNEGEQYTIYPNTLHWFKAGTDGAVISEFSTKSTDHLDIFSDSKIKREPQICD